MTLLRLIIFLLMPALACAQSSTRHKLDSLLIKFASFEVKNTDEDAIARIFFQYVDGLNNSHPDTAKMYAQKGLELSEEKGSFYGQGSCLVKLGDIAGPNWNAGLEYYFRALRALYYLRVYVKKISMQLAGIS